MKTFYFEWSIAVPGTSDSVKNLDYYTSNQTHMREVIDVQDDERVEPQLSCTVLGATNPKSSQPNCIKILEVEPSNKIISD